MTLVFVHLSCKRCYSVPGRQDNHNHRPPRSFVNTINIAFEIYYKIFTDIGIEPKTGKSRVTAITLVTLVVVLTRRPLEIFSRAGSGLQSVGWAALFY